MLRVCRVAQMRRMPVSTVTAVLRRQYTIPPTHFQKGDIPPEQNKNSSSASSGPKSFFQQGDSPPPPSGAAGRILVAEPGSKFGFKTILLILASISGLTAWYFYPRHSFSPEVATLLRKALKAESDSFGGQNLQEAVKYYIEALMEAEAQGLSPLSDEYTGIQLKLAEMYEMLNYPDAANDVYTEICAAYFDAFQKNKISLETRPEVVQRGLRIALKLAHIAGNENVTQASRALLLQILLAQQEVGRRCPQAVDLLRLASNPLTQSEREFMTLLTKAAAQARQLRAAGEFEAWAPFRDELIAARDVVTTYHLSANLPDQALREKQITYQIMLASGCGVGELLMAQANLASMYYFMCEKLEVVANNADKNEGTIIKSATGGDIPLDVIKTSSIKALARSEACYKRVLKAIPSLEPEVRRTKEVEEAQALCTYGVGVIAVKKGELDEAKDMLREARTRAKGSGFDDLVDAADSELNKLDDLAREAQKTLETDSKEKNVTVAEIHDAIANEIPEEKK
ncbi:Protein MRG3-like protein [Yarrowia sp. C11]|nr:Protein MRG3-like protein [Yarrowia sp. C11]KAG5370870.1 Protein MRG3-like protein [Yarrowia sp. E02]